MFSSILFEVLVKACVLNVSHRIAHVGLVHTSFDFVRVYFMSLTTGVYKRSTMQVSYQASTGGCGFNTLTFASLAYNWQDTHQNSFTCYNRKCICYKTKFICKGVATGTTSTTWVLPLFACQVKNTIYLYSNASYCFLPGYAKYKHLRIFGF